MDEWGGGGGKYRARNDDFDWLVGWSVSHSEPISLLLVEVFGIWPGNDAPRFKIQNKERHKANTEVNESKDG